MASNKGPAALPADQLTISVSSQMLPFDDPAQLEPVSGFLGHERAHDALHFGAGLQSQGYNLFVIGDPGTGRFSLTRGFLEQISAERDTPDDWLYLNNFDQEHEPITIRLPAGEGRSLIQDIEQLLDRLIATFPVTFENPGYQRKKARIEREFNQRYDRAIDSVERRASELGIALFRDDGTVGFTPIVNGKPLEETEFSALADAEKERYQDQIAELEELLSEQLLELPQWRRAAAESQDALNLSTINLAVRPLLKDLELSHRANLGVLRYLRAVKHHLPRVIVDQYLATHLLDHQDALDKRKTLAEILLPVLLVSHEPQVGAPVIYEPHPTYPNLFGRIEYISSQGTLTTNYRLIRPGALHRANGGYLLLDAEKLLAEPYVWHALKLALKTGEITLESPYVEAGLITTITLNPQPITLDLKLAIVGERQTYYLLQQLDPEFNKLFRVLADCDSDVPLTPQTLSYLARLLKTHADERQLPPLSMEALLDLFRYSCRLSENKTRLSTRISELFQLLEEASFYSQDNATASILQRHVRQAIEANRLRSGRLHQLVLDEIHAGSILIATEGKAIGRINGLSVISMGNTSFGIPARISATVYPGSDGVVDIEREVELGQPSHSKGVMILTGFIGNRYAREMPLSLSANIALEQSYGYIEGDSASLAEVCALLSALIQEPLRQDLAVTGSINQYGEVQAIGGANDKIEGFYKLCRLRGLTGSQGVVIPAANIRNLVLDPEVVEAVANGEFAVFAVHTVDQAMELLTGQTAGQWHEQGFERNTLNARIVERLEQIARQVGTVAKRRSF